MRKRTQAREYALQILYQYEVNPDDLDEILKVFWTDHEVGDKEIQEFAERVVRGCVAHLSALDQVISKYADNWQLHRMAAVDRNILRFAAYELLYMEDIPPKVTINEAVNIAKKFSQIDSGKFVNGILDKINHAEKPDSKAAGS